MRVLLALSLMINICFAAVPLHKLNVPQGYQISVYAENVPGARSMTLGDKGTVFVGTRGNGKVYALVPNTRGDKAQFIVTIAKGLNVPNGVTYKNGALYVAETNRVIRFDNIENRLKTPPKPVVIIDDLPNKSHHGWRYMDMGPDGYLYISIGAPCNVCLPGDTATIIRMKPDGSGKEIFARGVRNSVGFAWHPVTKELWFTCNGRDWLGDDLPPDELNHAPKAGMHFGFPYFYGNNVPDPDFGKGVSPKDKTPPIQALGAHVAALGMLFWDSKTILIAEHGSWNRSRKSGYRISRVRLHGNKSVAYEPFITGWQVRQTQWGRPVDLLRLKDGSMLISDDYADVIYRLSQK